MNCNYDKEGTFSHTVAILPGTGELNNKLNVSNEIDQAHISYKNGPLITESKYHFSGQGQTLNVAPGERRAFLRVDNVHPNNPNYSVLVRFTALISNANSKRGCSVITHDALGTFEFSQVRVDGVSVPTVTYVRDDNHKYGIFKTITHPLYPSFTIEYHNNNVASVDAHNVTYKYDVLLDKDAQIDVVLLNNN
jgi:hypothetical protein